MKTVTIVTPTLNCMRTIREYLDAIYEQNYPHNLIDIIFVEAGSTDGTVDVIEEYKNKKDIKITIVKNPLKTAEAGKAVGVRNAKGEIICLLDSDNIIPESNWITKMLEPFADENIIASEPLGYKYRKQDSVVNRYTALLGMGDPLCMFLGNYDRYCGITGKWTNVPYEAIDEENYLSIRFDEIIPTIGANGFFMRRNELVDNFEGDYLFDIDVLWNLFNKDKGLRVAKVKTEIVHLFCTDTKTFYRKQNRRIKDFLFFNESKGRTYPWNKSKKSGILLFGMSCITVVPLLIQAVVGYFRTGKKDLPAWMYHVIACWITLWVYATGSLIGIFYRKEANRESWKQ